MDLIYESKHLGTCIKVYQKYIEFNIGRKESVPISQIASIQCGMKIGFIEEKKIVIETTGGKKYSIPVKEPQKVRDKIYSIMQ